MPAPIPLYFRSCRRGFGRDGHPALCANDDGSAQANRFGPAREWERIELVLLGEPRNDGTIQVTLKGYHGKYLHADPNGHVHFAAPVACNNETFTLADAGGGTVSIKSVHGMFVCAEGGHRGNMGIGRDDVGGHIVADRTKADVWEMWRITDDAYAFTDPGLTAKLALEGTIASVGLLGAGLAFAIPAAGFGLGGVAVGSAAAAVQSTVYGAATSGLFSVLQSMGATVAWAPMAVAGAAGAGSGTAVMAHAVSSGGTGYGGRTFGPPELRSMA